MPSSITLMNYSSVPREEEEHIQTNSLCMRTRVFVCVCEAIGGEQESGGNGCYLCYVES